MGVVEELLACECGGAHDRRECKDYLVWRNRFDRIADSQMCAGARIIQLECLLRDHGVEIPDWPVNPQSS